MRKSLIVKMREDLENKGNAKMCANSYKELGISDEQIFYIRKTINNFSDKDINELSQIVANKIHGGIVSKEIRLAVFYIKMGWI